MNIRDLEINFKYKFLFDKPDDWWKNYIPPIDYLYDNTFLKLFVNKLNFNIIFYDVTQALRKDLDLNKLLKIYLDNINNNNNTQTNYFLKKISLDMFISDDIIIKYRQLLPWPIICYSQKLTNKLIDKLLILEKQDKKTYIIWYAILANSYI